MINKRRAAVPTVHLGDDGTGYVSTRDVKQMILDICDYVQYSDADGARAASDIFAFSEEISFLELVAAAQTPNRVPWWRAWLGVIDPRTWFTRRR